MFVSHPRISDNSVYLWQHLIPSNKKMEIHRMGSYDDLIAEALLRVREIMPWDLSRAIAAGNKPLLLDVREPSEFAMLRIPGSINVPRGVLEQSCEWDYDETVPELAARREQEIVIICRSGKRSILAADTLLLMGYTNVVSLKTGVRGWNDYEQPLENANGEVIDADTGDVLLAARLRPEQRKPKST
jgi:rhodanese-related sulfurtransferase